MPDAPDAHAPSPVVLPFVHAPAPAPAPVAAAPPAVKAPPPAPSPVFDIPVIPPSHRGPVVGDQVMYQGPGEDEQHQVMRALVLKVHESGSTKGMVDLHLFNGRLLGGATLEDGRFVPAYERENVKQVISQSGAEGWFWSEN